MIGTSARSIGQSRATRAQAGRTISATLGLAAAGIAPHAVVDNLPEDPAVQDSPLTGGDGLPIDEDTAPGPFTEDDPDAVVPEGI